MQKLRGIVFGWEGVLVNTREAYFRSVNTVLRRHGHVEIHKDTFDLLFVKGSVRMFISLGYPEDAELLSMERRQEYDRLISSFGTEHAECDCVRTMNSGILSKLKEERYKIAVATNSHKGPLEKLMDKFGMRPFVDAIVTLDEALVAKPHPHMVSLACEKLGLEPFECVLVGDRIIDMQAGKGAGTYCIGVARNESVRKALVEAGADEIAADLQGVLGLLQGVPE